MKSESGKQLINPQIQLFLDNLNSNHGPTIEKLPIEQARNVLVNAQSSANVKLPSKVNVSKRNIIVDGKKISINIVRPSNNNSLLPAFMFFHGGGWILGDFATHERLVRDLVLCTNAVAIFVNYTPSPEASYGIAINQAYDATRWVAENGKEINIDGSKISVIGNSAGGNMATVVALMSKMKNGPKICSQILLWPITDCNFNTISYKKFGKDRFLTKDMMIWFWDNYTKDLKQRKEIYASPLQATLLQLTGLPPTLIQTAENDILRDEGEAYGRKLEAAGVNVTVVRYNGMIHDFSLLNAISYVPTIAVSIENAGSFMKKYFN